MFAFLVRGSLRYRAFVLAVAAIMLGYGAITAAHLPIDVLPDLNQGIVTVMTEGPGLSAEEVEQHAVELLRTFERHRVVRHVRQRLDHRLRERATRVGAQAASLGSSVQAPSILFPRILWLDP